MKSFQQYPNTNFIAALLFLGLNGVRLVGVNVPSYRFIGEDAALRCLYDLEGEQLYSVKWYKDGSEFFRFIPGDPDQQITTFMLPGVTVNVWFIMNHFKTMFI